MIHQEGKIAVAKGIDSGMHIQWFSVVARVCGNELCCSFQESYPLGYINYFIPYLSLYVCPDTRALWILLFGRKEVVMVHLHFIILFTFVVSGCIGLCLQTQVFYRDE